MPSAIGSVDRARLAAVTAVAGAALVLAGCSDGAGAATASVTATVTTTVTALPPTAAAAPTTPATAATPSTPSSRVTPTTGSAAGVAAFVAAVRASLPDVAAGRSADEVGQLSEQACTGLAGDVTADDLVAQVRSLGTLDAEATDQATARELIKLAIDTVCLDQSDRVDEF